jgi:hypothetical protein
VSAERVAAADPWGPRAAGEAWRLAAVPAAAALAAALSLSAALVHLSLVPWQMQVWPGYGAFFLAATAGQALLAAALLRVRTPAVLLAGLAGTLAIVLTYVLTRTRGVPLGPHAGHALKAGELDVATTVAELAVVAVLVSLLPPAQARRASTVLLCVGGALWALRLTGRLF